MRLGRPAAAISSSLLVCAAVAAARAAGQGDQVIARVGEVEIQRAAFEAELAEAAPDTTKTEAEARRDLLDALINRQLLALAAREAEMFAPDSLLERKLRNHEEGLLFRRMRDLEIRAKIEVTEAAVEEFYAKQAVAFDASQIVVASEEEAVQVKARLAAGADFAALADSLSLDSRTAGRGGRLPLFVWGTTSLRFLRELETMNPGEVRGPLGTEVGYHIIRLNDRVPRPHQPPFAEVREFMTERYRLRAEMERAGAYYAELDRRYQFRPSWEAAREVSRRCKEALARAAAANPEITAEEQAELALQQIVLPDSLLAQPLATWDFGRISVGEIWTALTEMPGVVLIERQNPHQVVLDAASEFRRQAMVREARERGMDRDPDFRRRVELRREELIVTAFYRSRVVESAAFSEAEEREYYEAHPQQFELPRQLRVATIQYRQAWAAEEMERAMREPGGDPDSLFAAHETSGVVRTNSRGGLWITEAERPVVFERADALQPGQVARLIDDEGYWTVLVLLDRTEARKLSFEEARNTVQTSLRNLKSDEVLNRFLDELRARYPVWIDAAYLSQATEGD